MCWACGLIASKQSTDYDTQQNCSQLLDIDTYLQGPAVFEFDADRLLRGDETPLI